MLKKKRLQTLKKQRELTELLPELPNVASALAVEAYLDIDIDAPATEELLDG